MISPEDVIELKKEGLCDKCIEGLASGRITPTSEEGFCEKCNDILSESYSYIVKHSYFNLRKVGFCEHCATRLAYNTIKPENNWGMVENCPKCKNTVDKYSSMPLDKVEGAVRQKINS